MWIEEVGAVCSRRVFGIVDRIALNVEALTHRKAQELGSHESCLRSRWLTTGQFEEDAFVAGADAKFRCPEKRELANV